MKWLVRTITFAALVALTGCSKNAPPTRDTTESDRLQGVWAVESVECGVELTPQARQRMMDSRLHVHESRFTLGAGDQWEFYTFAVDGSREPKKLLLYEAPPESKAGNKKGGIPKAPRTKGWIYKYEGEKLVLAFLRGDDSNSVPPPADFKPEPGQNVMVLQLVKTNEEPRTNWDVKAPTGAKK